MVAQLNAYATGARKNDVYGRMRDIAGKLTPEEREQLAASLKASETPKSRLAASAEKRLALAVDSVSRLRQTLVNEPMRLREVLREAVERIGVKATKNDHQRTRRRIVLRGPNRSPR